MNCAADKTLGRKMHRFGLENQYPNSSQSAWTISNKMKLNEDIFRGLFFQIQNKSLKNRLIKVTTNREPVVPIENEKGLPVAS